MSNSKGQDDFYAWLKMGIENGWCGPTVCYTHDGFPMSAEEDEEFDSGSDPCMHMIRMYFDEGHKKAVEESHSPSQWRNHYTE